MTPARLEELDRFLGPQDREPRVDLSQVQDWLRAHRNGWAFWEVTALGAKVEDVFLFGRKVILDRAKDLGIREHLRVLASGEDLLVRVLPPAERGQGFRTEVVR